MRHLTPPEYTDRDPTDRPSRSARKRAAQALQELGEQLLDLRPAELAQLPLPEALRTAVAEARAIRRGPAQARARQYIGRLMRELEDVEALRAALAGLRGGVPAHGRMRR